MIPVDNRDEIIRLLQRTNNVLLDLNAAISKTPLWERVKWLEGELDAAKKKIADCPIVEMPDVEKLLNRLPGCPPTQDVCPDAHDACGRCWREYLEAKLKESRCE